MKKVCKMSIVKYTLAAITLLAAGQSYSSSFMELNLSVDQRFMEVFRFNVDNRPEESQSFGAGIAAYRPLSSSSSLGVAVEYFVPHGRDLEAGSGKITGFRFADYRKQYSPRWDIEYFFGFAQYDWIKTATGYYGGIIGHYKLKMNSPWSLGFALRHYEGLTHDGGPGGDQWVNGQVVSLGIHYRIGGGETQ